MIVVQHFLKWIETAKVSERAAAAAALARAFVTHELAFEDRFAAEAALTLLLDDASPKVRLALAEALSLSGQAPLQVVMALAADQPEVAAPILVRSPLLADGDLVDLVATGSALSQSLIAMRPRVSITVSAAIAEIAEPRACIELLANTGAEIASVSFRRMVERHGDDARLREALIEDPRVLGDCRHALLVRIGEALRETPLVVALMGATRAERMTRDACLKASLTLIEKTDAREHLALVEHLRIRGDLTVGFVIRTIAHGRIDFFGAVLVSLGGQKEERVRALLSGGGDSALCALFRQSGLSRASHAPILRALKVWRDVANGKRVAGPQEVSWLMLRELDRMPARGEEKAAADLAGLLNSIHLEVLRENARIQALAIAAA